MCPRENGQNARANKDTCLQGILEGGGEIKEEYSLHIYTSKLQRSGSIYEGRAGDLPLIRNIIPRGF